jgi:hypothetical protein
VRIYRLNIERRGAGRIRLQWLGPGRTYTLRTWRRTSSAGWSVTITLRQADRADC